MTEEKKKKSNSNAFKYAVKANLFFFLKKSGPIILGIRKYAIYLSLSKLRLVNYLSWNQVSVFSFSDCMESIMTLI